MFQNAHTAGKIASLMVFLAVSACDDSTSPGPNVPLTLSIALEQNAPAAVGDFGSGVLAGDIMQEDGSHTLVISRAAMVLKEVELQLVSAPDCLDGEGPAGEEFEDDCEEIEVGPFLIEFPLDGSVSTAISVDVPPGAYDEVEFEVHTPDDDTPADLDFLLAYPEFKGVSIRVEGTFDGEDFIFLQDLDAEQEMALVPPLEVTDGGGPVNLTLTIDLRSWFLDGDGGLIDPRDANKGGIFEDAVEENIEASIDVFEDDDRDGEDDD
jgi:hypothetical protein